MKIVFLDLVLLYVLFLTFPIIIKIKIHDDDFFIYLFGILVLQQNIFDASRETFEVTRDSFLSEIIKIDDIIYLRLVRKIKIKKLEIIIGDYKDKYDKRAIIYGQLNGLFANIDRYCATKKIPFDYSVKYLDVPSSFQGIFVLQLGKILVEYLHLRRLKNERTSHSSVT